MLKLIKNSVAVLPIGDSDKAGSLGILYRPDQSKGRIKQGIIKYVGQEVKEAKIGDYVFFSGYAGILFRLEGEGTLVLLHEENLLAILSERVTEIDGLFFYGGDGKYFRANYEQAMILISRSLESLNVEVKEPEEERRKGRRTKTNQGKLFLIRPTPSSAGQEHEMGPDCFCHDNAYEFNKGKCPKCGELMHFASNPTWPENFYMCENMRCQFNTLKLNNSLITVED